MSATSGPNIVENGLVFCVDPGDNRSVVMDSPSNLISNSQNMQGWTTYYWTNSAPQITTDFGTIGYKFTNQPSWNGVYRIITVPSAGVYTFSAWIKYIAGSSANNGATVYINGQGGVGYDVVTGIDKTKINEWQKISVTFSATNLSFGLYLISYGGDSSGSGTDWSSWEVTLPQLEQQSFATPYNASDISEYFSDGIFNGTPQFSSSGLGSLVFNSTKQQYIYGPENSALNTQTPSINCWIKTGATTQNGFWFEKGNVNTQYSLFQEAGYIVWRQLLNSGLTNLVLNPTSSHMNTSTWANICATYNSSTGARRIYVNGQLQASDSITGTIQTNTNGWSIGAYGGFNGARSYFYNGSISHIGVYNVELSSTQVKQNFDALRVRFGV